MAEVGRGWTPRRVRRKLERKLAKINRRLGLDAESTRSVDPTQLTATGYEPGAEIHSRSGVIYQVQKDGSHRKLERRGTAGEFEQIKQEEAAREPVAGAKPPQPTTITNPRGRAALAALVGAALDRRAR